MRTRTLCMLVALIVVAGLKLLPAAAVSYDIVYVRAPRHGDNGLTRWADAFRPMWVEPGSDLVIRRSSGQLEVLVAAGANGAVVDPCVSFDAKTVFYSYSPDVVAGASSQGTPPFAGFDVYKVDVATKMITRLTNQERTPNTSISRANPNYPVFNMGPCPVSGGKIVFTSNRNGFIPTKGYTPITSQLYVMNVDGSNIHAIDPMTLGAALHPFQLKDGRIAFSSYETQGLRDERIWGLWSIWPDGRQWAPLLSAFSKESAFHFASQLAGGDVVVEDYYNLNNAGFGAFYRFPTTPATPSFYPAFIDQNPPLTETDPFVGPFIMRYPFSPMGIFAITPFTTHIDAAAPLGPGAGTRVGKVTHPSGAPNGDLLLVWSGGPVNYLTRPVALPAIDSGIYVARNGGPVESASDLVLVVNDPNYNEQWPRALVPYKAIYGVDEPHQFPFLPNDGTVQPSLPVGTPYGIIGTSSLYKRESFPGRSIATSSYDGLEGFNAPGDGVNSNWISQGADAGRYDNSDIAAVRILMLEPTSESDRKWFNHVNERMRVLGEIPVRKTNANGSPVLDPEGNPDTSFSARVPADTPITFQMLDAKGHVLTMAQTWHQVRPGEQRTDCGGCHAHSQAPLAFERTAAASMPPVDLTLQPAHDVEFVRDIRPLLQRACVSCHKGTTPPGGLAFDAQTIVGGTYPDSGSFGTPRDYTMLARNAGPQWGTKSVNNSLGFYGFPNASRVLRKMQSRRSLLQWLLEGARLDGWTNAQWPTETVPGDPSTLPDAGARALADVDYRDTARHSGMLTPAEQRLVATWIDLGAPVDLGGGYWQDEIRPTLALKPSDGTLIIGAADAYSGVDAASLSVTIDNHPTALTSLGDGRWSTSLPSSAAIVSAKVKDRAGNWTEQTIRVSEGAVNSSSLQSRGPRPPANVRIVR